jgi:integrase
MQKIKRSDSDRFKIGDYWLSKRPDARGDLWYRTWYDSAAKQTRRISLCTRDFEEAKVKLAEWILGSQNLTDEDPSTVPLATVILRYWNDHGSKVRSRETIKLDLEKWKTFFGPVMVSDLTKRRVKEFIQHLEEKGHSPGGINRVLSDGRAALNRAKREGELTSVPFIPSVPTGEPKERAISLDQMAKIFDGVKSAHVFLFCLLAANTMARPEPLFELTRFQLDFESKLIKLNPEGRKQTKKYRPTVPMTDTLIPWLQKIKTSHIVQYHGHRIFSVKKAFQRMAIEIDGLPERVTPYSIRHTMAKELRRRGVSPWEIQGMLGHKAAGFRTTEIYAKYDPSYLSTARVEIDAIMAEIDGRMTKRRLILSDKPSLAFAR